MADKTYLYKVYRGGAYLGNLDNVSSEMSISQDINTSFSQMTIQVNKSPLTIDDPVEPLLDETGAALLDESNNPLYEERRPPIIGDGDDGILIRRDNQVKVYEYSDDDVNGRLMFDGWITDYEADFGGNGGIAVTCMSRGVDLQEYINGGAITADQSQVTESTNTGVNTEDSSYGQTFRTGAGVTTLHSIKVKLARPTSLQAIGEYRMVVFANTTALSAAWVGGQSVATALGYSNYLEIDATAIHPTYVEHTFQFITPITVTPTTDYVFAIWSNPDNASNASCRMKSVSPSAYANGSVYNAPTYYNNYSADTSQDLYFVTYEGADDITGVYSSEDPTDIFKDAIDRYRAQGGVVDYDGTSDDTGLSVSYTFRLATALEMINKSLELAPSDWYWYVDPGSLIAAFRQFNTTADHVFIRGNHITKLKFKETGDDIRNKLYFSGGDIGAGVNLFSLYSNSASDSNRQRLDRISDNRVTVQATADTLSNNFLDEHSGKQLQTTITISDNKYDTDTIDMGEMVSFAGFGLEIDSLLFPIVRLVRRRDEIDITLGQIPPRLTTKQTQALRDIAAIQTVDNPDAPS